MPRRHLPALSFDATVSANTARQDKVEIRIEHGQTIYDADDGDHDENAAGEVGNFLNFLGSPPRVPGEPSAFGRIFTRPRRLVRPFANQAIRGTTRNQSHPPPLFSGSLHIQNVPGTNSAWRLSTLLSFNPTRFVRHQPFPAPAILHQANPSFLHSLFEGEVRAREGDEFALVENDNWIPDSPRWSVFASPRLWPVHLRTYLRNSMAEVHRDLQRAASLAGGAYCSRT